MDFKKQFKELAERFKLDYRYQEFSNCFGGTWFVFSHSLFNESGCFTVHCLPQRSEIDFYYASVFSTDRQRLCEESVDVFATETEIWKKRERVWIFKKPFYYDSINNTIKVLLEVIKAAGDKEGGFFGIRVKERTK